MPAVLDRILTEARALESDAAAAYSALVARLAADEEVPAGEVLTACEAAGRTLEQLTADVERLAARRRDAATLATLPDARRVRAGAAQHLADTANEAEAELVEKLDALERQKLAAVAERDRRVARAEAELARAESTVAACEQARQRLAESAPPGLVKRLAELRERRAALAHKAGELRQQVAKEDAIVSNANDLKNPAEPVWRSAREKAEAVAKADRIILYARPRREEAVRALEQVTAEAAEVESQIAAVEAEVLRP